jgi:hypothetical protein
VLSYQFFIINKYQSFSHEASLENKPYTESIQTLTDRLTIYLAAYRYYIDTKSSARLFDPAIFGEQFCRDIAKIIYGYTDLENLNFTSASTKTAIDLGSLQTKTAIQVTFINKKIKIVETLNGFVKNNLHLQYTNLKIIILKDKLKGYNDPSLLRTLGDFKFNPKTDVLDLNDLFRTVVDSNDVNKISDFIALLEGQLSSKIKPYLIGYQKPGQRLRELFNAHDASCINVTDKLKQYGVDRATYYDSNLLNQVATSNLIKYTADQFAVSENWLKGDDEHIYSNGPDLERFSDWRRTLDGAYDFIKKTTSAGGKLIIIIPHHKRISHIYSSEDVVDISQDGYEHFLLVIKDQNEFSTPRYKMLISDHLSYKKCVEGIFMLFLAAEIFQINSEERIYIDIAKVDKNNILRCYEGEALVVDVIRECNNENHKDYLYYNDGNFRLHKEYQSLLGFLNAQIDGAISEPKAISKINKVIVIPRIELSL